MHGSKGRRGANGARTSANANGAQSAKTTARMMQASLHYIRDGEMKMVGAGVSFDEYKRIVRFSRGG